jgi:Chaperone of endosialidase
MKMKLLTILILITLTCYHMESNAQANRQLSNLIAPTAVNVNLLPGGTTGTKNFGSDTKRWQDGHFDGTIYCHGQSNNTYGVYSTGVTSGVYGSGNSYGVYGIGGQYGVLGRGSSAAVYGYSTGWAGYFSGKVYSSGGYTTSDQKLKQNIRDFNSAMDIINKLKPKQYEFRQDGNYKLMNLPQGSHFGLIAQDVEKVLPGLVNDTKFETVIAQPQAPEAASQQTKEAPKTETKSEIIEFKALNYTELIPVLIKGMQELSQENDEKDKTIEELENRLSKIEKITAEYIPQQSQNVELAMAARLEQNVPNPFNNTTSIAYYLPTNKGSAYINFYASNGAFLKSVKLAGTGKGTINVTANELPSGAYRYSLIIDGKVVETKQMVQAK